MTIQTFSMADLRKQIDVGGTAAERREHNARLHDKSVSGVREAVDAIPTDGPVKDKTVGGIAQATKVLLVANGASFRDTSVGGMQAAKNLISGLDPLGERKLPQVWDSQAQLRDKSGSSVDKAGSILTALTAPDLRDTTARGTNRARDQIIAAAAQLLA